MRLLVPGRCGVRPVSLSGTGMDGVVKAILESAAFVRVLTTVRMRNEARLQGANLKQCEVTY